MRAKIQPRRKITLMALLLNRYGKGRVRVMRLHKAGDHHTVSELTIKAILEGDFAVAYTKADNSTSVATDTVKNVINVVAHENIALPTELFCKAATDRFLDTYPQVEKVTVTARETKWTRLSISGREHPHSFTLDGNGTPFAEVVADRNGFAVTSGVTGFTFLKTTQSGWSNYVKDGYTTLPETRDRLCGTSMDASWKWTTRLENYGAANAAVLATMLEVFATTYSESVQDSLYRMGEAALAAVPEVSEISMACPNKHYIPMNLSAFGIENKNEVFLPTDEPHGQIECTVGRG
jgi:urate oxidase